MGGEVQDLTLEVSSEKSLKETRRIVDGLYWCVFPWFLKRVRCSPTAHSFSDRTAGVNGPSEWWANVVSGTNRPVSRRPLSSSLIVITVFSQSPRVVKTSVRTASDVLRRVAVYAFLRTATQVSMALYVV